MKRCLTFIFLILSILLVTACTKKVEINVSEKEITIEIGQKKTLEIETSRKVKLQYESTDKKIVEVEKGVITGVGIGSAKIVVTYDEFREEINVTVTEKIFTVTFIPDEENLHLLTRVEVENGKLVRVMIPKKKGKEFVAWYLDGEVFSFKTPITSDIILVAGWMNEKKKISFNTNPPMDPVYITEGNEYYLPVIEREFYILERWAYFEDGNLVPLDNSFIVTKDIELIPIWIPNFYKITFDTQGGKNIETAKVEKGEVSNYQVFQVAEKEGKVFQYWGYYEGEELIKVYLDQVITITEDLTLIAFYE